MANLVTNDNDKIAATVFYFVRNSPKVAILWANLFTRLFNNGPIWSHSKLRNEGLQCLISDDVLVTVQASKSTSDTVIINS